MAHATIVSGEADEAKARKELALYMVSEASYLADSASRGWAKERIDGLFEQAKQVLLAEEKFPGVDNWEVINFNVGKLGFQLRRIARDV
jgi:hypothetical protein